VDVDAAPREARARCLRALQTLDARALSGEGRARTEALQRRGEALALAINAGGPLAHMRVPVCIVYL
jgi:hypothetical protein